MKKFTLFITGLMIAMVSFSQVDLTDGLVLYLPCDGDAVSSDGIEFIAEVPSTETVDVWGVEGNALMLPEAGNGIMKASALDIEDLPLEGDPRTLAAWVLFSDPATSNKHIISYGNPDKGQHCHLAMSNNDGAIRMGFWYNDTDSPNAAEDGFVEVRDEVWHHIVATLDIDGDGVTIYVDGEYLPVAAFDADQVPINTQIIDAYPNVAIGNDNRTGTTNFMGSIDEVRIYNRALSEDEVIALYEFDPSAVEEPGVSVKTSSLNSIKIYPNPATNLLNIKSQDQIQLIQIIDLTGKLALESTNVSGSIDISALRSGIYFAKVITGQGAAVRKITIK